MPARDAWWQRAACLGADPDIFEKKHMALHPRWAEPALAYCRVCPVKEQCLADAITFDPLEAYESSQANLIWGGLQPEDIRVLRRRRRKARR